MAQPGDPNFIGPTFTLKPKVTVATPQPLPTLKVVNSATTQQVLSPAFVGPVKPAPIAARGAPAQTNNMPAVPRPMQVDNAPALYQPTSTPKQLDMAKVADLKAGVTGVNGTPAPVPPKPPVVAQTGLDLTKSVLPRDNSTPSKVLTPLASGLLTLFSGPVNYIKNYGDILAENEASAAQATAKPQTVGKQVQTTERMGETGVFNKTNAQLIGESALAVFDVYMPSVGRKLVEKSVGTALAKEGLKELAKQGLKEGAAQGLQYGVAQALASGTTDPKEIAKIVALNVGGGALVGGTLSAAIPAVSKIISGVKQAQADLVSGLVAQGYSRQEAMKLASEGGFLGTLFDTPKVASAREAVSRLQSQLEAEIRKDKPSKAIVNRMRNAIRQAEISRDKIMRQELEGGYLKLPELKPREPKTPVSNMGSTTQRVRGQLVDYLAPLSDLVKQSKLPAAKNPYTAARNFAGRFGKVQNRLDDLSTVLTPAKDILPDVKHYGLLERYEELAGRGVTQFPDNLTPDMIRAQKAALAQALGPEKLARVEQTLEALRTYQDNLLQEARDAGIISAESYAQIKKDNEKYIPLQRLAYIEEQGDNFARGSNSFNVSSQSLVKRLGGSTKEVADPLESIVRNTYKTVDLVERNKVAQQVADLSSLPEFSDIVIPLRTAENVTERMSLFSEARELKPLQNKVERLIQTRGSWLRRLQTELRNLNKAGVKEATRPSTPTPLPELRSKVKIKTVAPGDEVVRFGKNDRLLERTPGKPGSVTATDAGFAIPTAAETRKFVERLITEENVNLAAIKRKIGTREPRLTELLDTIGTLRNNFDEIETYRRGLLDQGRDLKDLNVPQGMEKISVFRNGIKEEYAVPKEVGAALKNLNQQSADIVTGWARATGSLLRQGATTLNVAFIPSNTIRDFYTATVASKVGFTPFDWVRGFAEAVRKGDDYRKFLESGASFSGYFERNQNVNKTVRKLTEGKVVKAARYLNPLETIRRIGETLELAPRIGVFKRSLRKGKSLPEAALNSRNATVDFARAGSSMKVFNQWIPFLNARLQGTLNVAGAIKNKPVASALKLSALVGAPVVATYLNNTRNHAEVWKDIAQYEKDSNFLVIYGDERDKDGNPTQVVKIPKADVARIFGNPLEAFLSHLDGSDPKRLDQLAVDMLSDVSPVSFARNGDPSLQTLASSTLPPTAKAVVETATNKNLFTGRDIVPQYIDGVPSKNLPAEEQYTDRTGAPAKFIGKKLNFSPLKIENLAGTQFGGLGRQLIDPLKAPTTVAGRFSGARGGQDEIEKQKEAEAVLQVQAVDKLDLVRKAKVELDKIKAASDPVAAYMDLYRNDQALAEQVNKQGEKEGKGWNYTDALIDQMQVENGQRALYMYDQFQKLSTDEERAALWIDYTSKELLSKNVAEQLQYLFENGKP